MKYYEKNKSIIISNLKSFNIKETLECGQCFRFNKINDYTFNIVANNKLLTIIQQNDGLILFPLSEEEFKNQWIQYFDLNRDYDNIKKLLSEKDIVLKEAVAYAPGIRLLKQDIFECLISFIISQNNRIPMIKQVIKNMSEKFGDYITSFEGEEYYSFPKLNQLADATQEQLLECKMGFRAKYIIDAVQNVKNRSVQIDNFENMTTQEIKKQLMSIKGVGEKVSDCVLLFSCQRYEVFPTDVWIKRIMQHFYFNDAETKIDKIHQLAYSKFAQNAGFAQQYLFHYARHTNLKDKTLGARPLTTSLSS